MKQLTVEDAKQIELEILDYIDTLCKTQYQLYCINYGTLIETVRHEALSLGTTILIYPCLEGYQRFINIFQRGKKQSIALSLETDKNYFNNFIKITDSTTKIVILEIKTYESGIFIDISYR